MVLPHLDKNFQDSATNGYVTLVSVVILGVVAVSIVVSTLVISTDSLVATKSVEESRAARGLVDTCAEDALNEIRESIFFTGSSNITVGEGECDYNVSDSDNISNVLTFDFNEPLGSILFSDSTAYSNDGTCADGSRCPTAEVSGQCGTAVDFNGSDDIILVEDNESVDLSAGSIAMWIRPEAIGQFDTIISKATFDEGVLGGDISYMIYFSPGGLLTASSYQSVDSTLAIQAFGGTAVDLNTWHHVVATWDETGIHLYLNGEVDAFNSNSALSRITDAVLNVGQRFPDDNVYAFDGQIDQLQIWNRKISESEVVDLYENCPNESGSSGGNIISLSMDETIGATTFADSSGNGRNFICSGGNCPVAGVAGQCGTALEFDGAGDFLEDSDGESYINGLTDFTVSFWIESDIASTDKGVFVTRTPDGNDNGLGFRYDASGFSGGCTTCTKATKTAGATQNIETSNNSGTTSWQHVAIVSDGTTGASEIYFDGVANTPSFYSGDVSGALASSTTVQIGKGYKDSWSSTGWDGKIDQFDIWDRVLDQEEITEVFENCGLSVGGAAQIEKIIEITANIGNTIRKARLNAVASGTGVTLVKWEQVGDL
jgi:hypothetical protein